MAAARTVTTVEAHTGGEPFRIVTSGLPRIPGDTLVARRAWLAAHLDDVRRALILEPRGHADMYAGYLTEPVTPGADLAVIFAHNEGYSDHCGHGVIALATAAVTLGWVARTEPETRVGIDAPCGFIEAFCAWDGRRAGPVRFVNVPSFVWQLGVAVDTPSFGRVLGDVAFGGAFYIYVDGRPHGLRIEPGATQTLIRFGHEVKTAANLAVVVRHPEIPELSQIYGTIIDGDPQDPTATQSNCCVFADRQVDRSPTGSGTAGRVALLHAKGRMPASGLLINESIVGSTMTGRVLRETTLAGRDAVVPEVSGRAAIVGQATWILDPDDRLGGGFRL